MGRTVSCYITMKWLLWCFVFAWSSIAAPRIERIPGVWVPDCHMEAHSTKQVPPDWCQVASGNSGEPHSVGPTGDPPPLGPPRALGDSAKMAMTALLGLRSGRSVGYAA